MKVTTQTLASSQILYIPVTSCTIKMAVELTFFLSLFCQCSLSLGGGDVGALLKLSSMNIRVHVFWWTYALISSA